MCESILDLDRRISDRTLDAILIVVLCVSQIYILKAAPVSAASIYESTMTIVAKKYI